MDKGINMHKEIAMGQSGGIREASARGATVKMKKGGSVKSCCKKGGGKVGGKKGFSTKKGDC